MTVDVASLDRRTPAALRAFARAQHVAVLRRPDAVEPATPSDRDYWRFLLRRASLVGICAHYQTYDASGDENDWNLNIVPDAAYRWMLDPGILYALSLSSGAPSPIDLGEIKHYDGSRAIECELTPDDALYDKFSSAGLPITSGGWWPDGAEQQGLGPTGRRVGVYGVFAGDYGHGGRPEIHPFDAFWRAFKGPRSSTISWDLGVFQDDSNRFNGDWSRAPIDVEFRVPFCLDFPVSLRSPVTMRARFTLRRSPLCSVVGKNTRARPGPDVFTETFVAANVLLSPRARNRLEVTVEDRTGLPGGPFSLGLADVTFTATGAGRLRRRAWLAGAIVVRIAVDQDGFAYWNLSGPNSKTAADAASDGVVVVDEDGVFQEAAPAAGVRGPRPEAIRVVEARPVVSPGGDAGLAAEVVVERRPELGGPVRRSLTVRPREQPVLPADETESGAPVELESFDLFATAGLAAEPRAGTRVRADVSAAISRLAGLDRLGRSLPPLPATVEVDDFVAVDLAARYAPFRGGDVQGEERSLLSVTLTDALREPLGVRCDVRVTSADGNVRRLGPPGAGPPAAVGDGPSVTMTPRGTGHRLVVGPLGTEPTTVRVEATLEDRFGLRADARATVENFGLVDARPWVEQVAGISLAELRRRRERVEAAGRTAPDRDSLAALGMIRSLVGAIEALEGPEAAPARRVAGAVRLATRVAELMPPVGRAR
jgi:hypothetical protein